VKEDSVVTVAVAEGIVKLYAKEAPEHAVMVKKGEKAYVKRQKRAKPVKLKKKGPTTSPSPSGSNTVYDREAKNPLSYLSTKFSWKKNQFNQSVVDGTILNAASLASYKNIVLKIMYTKPNGKEVTTFITVYESIRPGERIDFHKNLVDIFSNTKTLNVIIDSAEVDTSSN